MTGIANESQFRKPFARMAALGVGRERGQAQQTVNGGMVAPREHVIPKGTWLYRFGQRGVPERVAMGEWWIDGEALELIDSYARAHKISLREGIRQTCYVPPDWSALDLVVQSRTVAPLLSYRGRGAVVSVKDAHGSTTRHMPATGSHRVHQLYIPGLASGDVRRDALGVIGFQFLPQE